MQLYVLRRRWGSHVESVHKPWLSTAAEVNEIKVMIAGMPPWLQIPYEVGKWGYPATGAAVEMALYFYIRAAFTWGLVHAEAAAYTNAQLALWIAHIKAGFLIGAVFYFVVLPVVLTGVVWLLNPSVTQFVAHVVFPHRYIVAYKEKIWPAAFVAKDMEGRSYYFICPYSGALRMTVQRRVWCAGEMLDRWDFAGSWVQPYSEPLRYQEWRWDTAWVDYIGPCVGVGNYSYMLQGPATDPYVAEMPPGYTQPANLVCKGWGEIP